MASINDEIEKIDNNEHTLAAATIQTHAPANDDTNGMSDQLGDIFDEVVNTQEKDEREKCEEDKDRKRRRATTDAEPNEKKAPASRIRRVGKAPKLEHKGTEQQESNENQTGFKSKHDLKWDMMFDKLVEYKHKFHNTMVPQCYDQDPRLGRWVHYQRVEYWLYRSKGKAKITKDRIDRLEKLGFEWDPQKAQWEHMFEKLQAFQKDKGHCIVPKGYREDPNLANWVRNQRLEFANLQKGKKTRMTEDRRHRLDLIRFRWSNTKLNTNSGDEKSQDLRIVEKHKKGDRSLQPKATETSMV